MKRNVLTLSYAPRVLEAGSREQIRLARLSESLDRHYMIVFTRARQNLSAEFKCGALTVLGTQAESKVGIFIQSLRLGYRVLRQYRDEPFTISCQNPFEAGMIGYLLSSWFKQNLHLQIHGDNFGNPHWLSESWINHLRHAFGRWLLSRATGIRVVSERIKKALMELGVPTEKITVLPVHLELRPFLAIERDRQASEKVVHCLYAGRFSPEKNLPLLLTAFSSAKAQVPTLTLELIGAGPELQHCIKLTQRLNLGNSVTFTSWTNDMPSKLAATDMLLLTSNHEGYGLVLLEAMAASVAVVTTDVGLAGEILRPNVHGTVVPVGDKQKLIEAIVNLANSSNLREHYGKTGHVAAEALMVAQSDYATAWRNSFFPVR